MLVVTHEMEFARNVSNTVLFMEDGVVIEHAHTKEFFNAPKSERAREFVHRILSREE